MRPLAVVLLTAAFGGVLGFVGLREFRRRRRPLPRPPSNPDTVSSNPNDNDRVETLSFASARHPVPYRRPARMPIVMVLFEFLIVVISFLLAWVVSPAEPSFLIMLHMVMIWVSLRSAGVSLPPVSDVRDDYPPPIAAITPDDDKPDIDGDSSSRDPVAFLGRPPSPSSDGYQWIGPLKATFEADICSAVHNYWTFFGSEFMPKLNAELIDCKVADSGQHLVHRSVRLQLNPPYFIKTALGGVSEVEIRERSVWNPDDRTFRVYSSNISSRRFVTVMDICQMRADESIPDRACMTRYVCFQVSNSVGILRGSLAALIRNMIQKKADEFFAKFRDHLKCGHVSPDPNNVLSLIGNMPSA